MQAFAALVQELLHGAVRRGWLQQFDGGFARRQDSDAHFLPGTLSVRRCFKPSVSTQNFFASSMLFTAMPMWSMPLIIARQGILHYSRRS